MKTQHHIIVLALIALLSACIDEGDDGSSKVDSINPVDDSFSAKLTAGDIAVIAEDIVAGLAQGSHSDTVVNGKSGTATVTGSISTTDSNCGTDCLSTHSNHSITIVFNKYSVNSSSNEVTKISSGSVFYTDSRYYQQSGLNYTSGGGISIEGANMEFESIGTDSVGTFGTRDSIVSVLASGSSTSFSSLSGSLATESGASFTF